MHRCGLSSFVLVAVISNVRGHATGPPLDEHPELCSDRFPSGHGAEAMTSAAPYELAVSDSCYNESATIKARLRINNPDDENSFFEGFLILARKENDTMSYGVFDHMNTEYMQTLSCNPGAMNALGHSAAKHYLARTFHWTAPASDEGPIRLVATVVREKEEIWMDVMSEEIVYNADCAVTASLQDEEFGDIDESAPCSASHDDCDGASTASLHYLLLTITMATAVVFFKR